MRRLEDPLLFISGRLYLCQRCGCLVLICRACDHGNIYCFGECAQIRRCESKRRASRNYQNTFKGRINHAECQARYRSRKKEEVTDHGSQINDQYVLLVADEIKPTEMWQPVEVEQSAEAEEPVIAEQTPVIAEQTKEDEKTEPDRAVRAAKDMDCCHSCGSWCGKFVRLEPWRGGRYYKRQRGKQYDSTRRHRGRDSPLSLRREMAKKYNS